MPRSSRAAVDQKKGRPQGARKPRSGRRRCRSVDKSDPRAVHGDGPHAAMQFKLRANSSGETKDIKYLWDGLATWPVLDQASFARFNTNAEHFFCNAQSVAALPQIYLRPIF